MLCRSIVTWHRWVCYRHGHLIDQGYPSVGCLLSLCKRQSWPLILLFLIRERQSFHIILRTRGSGLGALLQALRLLFSCSSQSLELGHLWRAIATAQKTTSGPWRLQEGRFPMLRHIQPWHVAKE